MFPSKQSLHEESKREAPADHSEGVRNDKLNVVIITPALLEENSEYSDEQRIAFNLGKPEMLEDISNTLTKLGHSVRICMATFENSDRVVSQIRPNELVMNLCDGTDVDGVVGVSIVKLFEKAGLAFTGANSVFYELTSEKSRMKRCFEEHKVPTCPFRCLVTGEDASTITPENLQLGSGDVKRWPLFVKPDDAYGSMGVSDDCVVRNPVELAKQVAALRKQGFQRLIFEPFLDGDEYSVLLTDEKVYPAVRKVYMRQGALCLDFKADWIDNSYLMQTVQDAELSQRIGSIAKKAYHAVQGNSYARVDLRADSKTGEIYVLEVNSQPGVGDNSTAWDIIYGYAALAKRAKAEVVNEFWTDVLKHPFRAVPAVSDGLIEDPGEGQHQQLQQGQQQRKQSQDSPLFCSAAATDRPASAGSDTSNSPLSSSVSSISSTSNSPKNNEDPKNNEELLSAINLNQNPGNATVHNVAIIALPVSAIADTGYR